MQEKDIYNSHGFTVLNKYILNNSHLKKFQQVREKERERVEVGRPYIIHAMSLTQKALHSTSNLHKTKPSNMYNLNRVSEAHEFFP